MILSPATMNRSGSLRPSAQRARLRQVCLDSFVPVVSSTSRKLGRLSPLDLRVKGFNSRRTIVPVECGVCFSESLRLNRKGWNQRVHVSLPPPVVTSALKKGCNGDATTNRVLPDGSHVAIVSIKHTSALFQQQTKS